ncbi:MAG: hypothetical protein ACRD9Q_03535 [Nitrososphaeraceae archaeon]
MPKLRAYSIKDLKKALMELIGNSGEKELLHKGWMAKKKFVKTVSNNRMMV